MIKKVLKFSASAVGIIILGLFYRGRHERSFHIASHTCKTSDHRTMENNSILLHLYPIDFFREID